MRSTNLDSRMGNRMGEFSLLFIADVGLKFLFETIFDRVFVLSGIVVCPSMNFSDLHISTTKLQEKAF